MPERYIGLMSGTSIDAIDAAVLDLRPGTYRLLACHSQPMPTALRDGLLAAARSQHDTLDEVARLDVELGECLARTVLELLTKAQLDARDIEAIGSHGQTVRHRPAAPHPFSVQIGDPNIIAERTRITTVADFRRRDIAAGGQGAPLAPAFHCAAFTEPGERRVVVNIGGMANITVLPASGDEAVIGFDTGPGNVLMDAWSVRHRGSPYDDRGAWAAAGTLDQGLLGQLLADPYFALTPPKSTGREHFDQEWLDDNLARRGGAAETVTIQATLCELTAQTVATAIRKHAPDCQRVLICGGGAHNDHLMARLSALLAPTAVQDTLSHGIDPDWVEAATFAWLAQQTLAGQRGALASVTGARHDAALGAIYPATASRPVRPAARQT